MSRKTVSFGKPAATAEDWIQQPTNDAAKSEKRAPLKVAEPVEQKMKRLTIEMTDDLHRRIKATCAKNGVRMADTVRAMLEKEFPHDA